MMSRIPRRARVLWLALAIALAIGVGVAVQRSIGWHSVLHAAAEIDAHAWLALLGLLAASYVARVVRAWHLLRNIDARSRLPHAAAVFFVHNAVLSLLPARVGEIAMPLLARRWMGIDWASTLGALAWWRVTDAAAVGALAIALIAMGVGVLAPVYALALAAGTLPFLALAARALVVRLAAREPLAGRLHVKAILARVVSGMPVRTRAITADVALALIAWSTKIAAFTLFIAGVLQARGLDALPPWPQLAGAALAGDVSGALPLPTLAGVGPFEAAVVLGLASLGIDSGTGLTVAVLLHAVVFAANVLLGGAVGLAIAATMSARRAGPVA